MTIDTNKHIVRRFNTEVIVGGDRAAFEELVAPDFINRSAPANTPDGRDGLWNTFATVLRPAFPNLAVTIHDQIAEGDRVTTRKTITGTQDGALLGIAPTGRAVAIQIIDIVRLADGRYVEHWGLNTLSSVLAELRHG